jgi:hypothetical protein
VAPKPSAELINLSDEIRNLNLFRTAFKYQDQGEITAKFVVPSAQIESVVKVDKDGKLTGFRRDNKRLVDPKSVCNLLEEINA